MWWSDLAALLPDLAPLRDVHLDHLALQAGIGLAIALLIPRSWPG